MTKKKGLLLLNLGTPDDPSPEAVGRYLKEFLMDKWVVDIPWPLRWWLTNILVVPRRKHASSEAYKTIWDSRGSPLRYHLDDLSLRVQALAPERVVKSGMRYGQPSLRQAFHEFRREGVSDICVFPLYPQYAESSTRSSFELCRKLSDEIFKHEVNLSFVQDYYDHPAFVAAYARELKAHLETHPDEHVLMSFHGLPERHLRKVDKTGGQYCLRVNDCCEKMTDDNRLCYRAQSVHTARAIAQACQLDRERYTLSFQSRLGRTKWIEPYTDVVIPELAQKKHVKRLVVLCPSFTADCLETLEEMGDRGRRLFLEAGGESFTLLPCLNANPDWAEAILRIAADAV